MHQAGVEPNVATCSTLIRTSEQGRQFGRIPQLLEEMRSRCFGLEDAATYSAALRLERLRETQTVGTV